MAGIVPGILDNISKVIDHSDYGIKISKAGADALTASDNDLLFNSSWPSLQIVSVTTVDTTITNVIPHSLKFPPFALLFNSDMGFMQNVCVDANNIYINPFTINSFTTPSAFLVVYNLDLSTDIEYPFSSALPTVRPYDQDYGIKVPKLGKTTDSTDLRDYILHSRTGSPLVLAVKNLSTANPANPTYIQYTNKIGYATFNFGYVKVLFGSSFTPVGSYKAAPLQSQAYPGTGTNGITTQLLIDGVLFSDGAVVCLRNPMFATTNTMNVTY